MNRPLVSMLVCTFNRADMLRDALQSLLPQHTDNQFDLELIVIDNASTDHTPAVVQEIAASASLPVRYVFEPRPGVAQARNRAVKEARGEWLAFFDDDQLADLDWVWQLWQLATRQAVACVAGAVELKLPDDFTGDFPAAAQQILGATPPLAAAAELAGRIVPGTGNAMIQKVVFERVGGFDETLVEAGEDNDFFRRVRAAGFSIWRTPHAIVRHVIHASRMTDEYLRWTAHRIGWYLGRIQCTQQSSAWIFANVLLRLAHAAVVHGPRWLWFTLTGNRAARLGVACHWWRLSGYVQCAAYSANPRWFPATRFREQHNFREGRKLAAEPATSAPASEAAS